MSFSQNLTEFGGLPVVDLADEWSDSAVRTATARSAGIAYSPPDQDPDSSPARLERALRAPETVAWSLRPQREEDRLSVLLPRFADTVDTSRVGALVIGNWFYEDGPDPASAARDLLVELAPALPALRSLFFGDITFRESEISWIGQTDLAPLLAAYPRLAELGVRGSGNRSRLSPSGNLRLQVPEHRGLRSLTVESGGMPKELTREIAASGLPRLERLELWLGRKRYKGNSGPEDLEPVLSGEAFPGLRHLGPRNTEHTDDWVAALAEAPVTARLETLDLSLGVLTDTGARTILDTPVFHGLQRLVLHHHYLSEEMQQRLGTALTASGVEHDLSDRREPEEFDDEVYYYTAVGE